MSQPLNSLPGSSVSVSSENTTNTTLHVISHTHWDREWFAPYTITRRWLPELIDNLDRLVANNPDYKFLFDAQTMVMDDLKVVDKKSYATACKLIRNGNLLIGPYCAQIEMRLPDAESLVRNLRVGIDKTKELSGSTDFTAWCVDVFGFVSQLPQIHGHFGINNVYLWRGTDRLEPFFWWEGADGTTMMAVSLFAGGYRNFYRVTAKPSLALLRMQHEVDKLRPYYKLGHIPVFDGYDLDRDPGDAASYFAIHNEDYLAKNGIEVVSSSPLQFAQEVRTQARGLPTLSGELNSGKFSSVFPGTLSARTYSKLLLGHAERLLYRYAEPISSLLPASKYDEKMFEDQSKLIIQNLVHDVVAGTCIDQIHQVAEMRVQKLDRTLKSKAKEALTSLAGSLEDGIYAYLPAPGETNLNITHKGKLYRVAGRGVSITKVGSVTQLPDTGRNAPEFKWKNRHFEMTLRADGGLEFANGRFGQLVVRKEEGDTYWDEPSGHATPLTVQGPLRIQNETDNFAQVSFTATAQSEEHSIQADVTLTFDDSPLVKWQVKLSSTGTAFSVLMRHSYNSSIEKLNVGMPFDNVGRDFKDSSLLGRELDPDLAATLNDFGGQRDLYQTFTFPFHSYISPALPGNKIHVLARGLRAYQTEEPGNVDLVLCRAVDWVMKPEGHEYHCGDAGPKYYVPDARSQRETVIDCALLISEAGPDNISFHQAVDQYICAPLLFRVKGSSGTQSHLSLLDEPAVISSLHQYKGKRLARIFNPTTQPVPLNREYTALHQDSIEEDEAASVLAPKAIKTVTLEPAEESSSNKNPAHATIINWPQYPVGPDNSKPDPRMIEELNTMYKALLKELDGLTAALEEYGTGAPHSLWHQYHVVARECTEAQLSLLWNKRRAEQPQKLTEKYAAGASKELQDLESRYNDLRAVRRMYDYIIGLDKEI